MQLLSPTGALPYGVGRNVPQAEIEAAAKKEGMLTTIALPHDWCNYGEAIEGFKKKYADDFYAITTYSAIQLLAAYLEEAHKGDYRLA